MTTHLYFNLWAWPKLLLALPFASFTAVQLAAVSTQHMSSEHIAVA